MNIEKLLKNCCDPKVIHICYNCRHAGDYNSCECLQRFLDIKHNCEKEDTEYDYCAYFEEA